MLITTLVISFCKDGGGSINVKLWFLVVYIQNLQKEGKLIPEQYPGEPNPLFRTAINFQPPHTTWKDQLCFSLQPGHYSNLQQTKLCTVSNSQH